MHKVEELGLIHQERICCMVESAWPEDIIYFHVWKVEGRWVWCNNSERSWFYKRFSLSDLWGVI